MLNIKSVSLSDRPKRKFSIKLLLTNRKQLLHCFYLFIFFIKFNLRKSKQISLKQFKFIITESFR